VITPGATDGLKKRIEHLNQQNQDYRALRARAKVNKAIGPGGEDMREFEAIQKQHKREQIELMMLKTSWERSAPMSAKPSSNSSRKDGAMFRGSIANVQTSRVTQAKDHYEAKY
jgi:hypothetical protein